MWYFLGALLVIILLLLFAPFTLHIYFLEELRLKIRFLVFSKVLLPQKEKPEKEKTEKEKKPKKEKEKKKQTETEDKKEGKKLTLREKYDLAVRILKGLKLPFLKFLKKIKIHGIKLEIMVASGDAFKTGQTFVQINEGVLYILGLMEQIFDVKAKEVYIYPDFKEEKTKLYAECDIKVNVIMCIILVVSILKTSGKDILKLAKSA